MQQLRYSIYAKPLIIIIDLILMLSVVGYCFNRFNLLTSKDLDTDSLVIISFLLCTLWILLSGRTKIYSIPRNLTFTLYLERLFVHIFLFVIGMLLLVKVSKIDFLENQRFEVALGISIVILLVKSVLFFTLKALRISGLNNRNIMFLSENESSEMLKRSMKARKDYGFKIFEYPHSSINLNELTDFWKQNGIYSVFIPTENNFDEPLQQQLIKIAEDNKVRISLIPNLFNDHYFEYELNYIRTQPVLFPARFPLDYPSNYILKRFFDIIISIGFLLLIGWWLIPLVAIFIKLESRGPVFFKQKRYGYKDHVFYCIKFRTMVVNSFSDEKVTAENDDRITRVGKVLRRFNIDEIPQLFNVIAGEMSIVGPRPHMVTIDDFYRPQLRKYAMRSMIKPGITGLAQVNGLRGDHGNMKIEMQKRVLADAFYVKNWSLSLDLVILFKTFFIIFFNSDKPKKGS